MLNEVFILAQQATDDEAIRYEIITGRRAPWNDTASKAQGARGPRRTLAQKGGR